jgi:peptide/nickel transport system substrate-binding protein
MVKTRARARPHWVGSQKQSQSATQWKDLAGRGPGDSVESAEPVSAGLHSMWEEKQVSMNRREAVKLFGGGLGLAYLGAPVLSFAQASGSTLVVAMDEVPKQLDPLLYQTNPGYRTMWNVFDSLLTVDYGGDGALKPALAASWKRVDGQTVDVVLRDGVTFHDGSPLTVEDVVFSLGPQRIADKNSPGFGTAQQFLATIAGAEARDSKTVRITSKTTDPTLELRLTAWGSQIISKAAFEKNGGWDGYGRNPVATGPYQVVSITPDAITLKAFPKYWNGEPKITNLTFRSAPELSSRIASLNSGDFDVAVDVPTDQFAAVTRSPNLEIVGGTIASIRVVKYDTRNPQLKDVRVRKALGLAIDRKAIVDALWAGMVDIPHGHQLPSFGPLVNPDRPAYQYDPDQAKKLLDEAGYKGETIPYRIRVAAYGPELATAQVLIAMWQAVGVNLDMQIKENFGQLMEYPGTGIRNGVDPVLVNDPLFGLWRSYDDSQKEIWANQEFFDLGHKLQTSLDLEERKQAFWRMMDIFDEDPPAAILHTMGTFYGKEKTLQWTPWPSSYVSFASASMS